MSEPAGISTGGIIGIVGAMLGLIGGPAAIGKAVKWWTARADRRAKSRADGNREWESKLKHREADLDARETAFKANLQRGLEECERHCEAVKGELESLRDDHKVVVLAIRIAIPKLAADAADSPELRMIRTLLAARFPADPNVPSDMFGLLQLIDQKTT